MTSGSSGAVFFLGTRAHYQVLQTPDTVSYDIENGNASTETIYQNISADNLNSPLSGDIPNAGNILTNEWAKDCSNEVTLLDCDESGNFDFRTGIIRRRRREGSNEYILNDNDDFIDIDPSSLNMCDSGSPKSKDQSRRCLNLRALLSNLKVRRKTKFQAETLDYANNSLSMCAYKDSCRCLDCQSRYFECDESEYSDSESERSLTPLPIIPEPLKQDESTDENDEVFIDDAPKPAPPSAPSVPGVISEEHDEMQVHMAAGTPVVLDYLLHHPFTCNIQ